MTAPDPVEYTILVQHWQDGDVDVTVKDVGHSEKDRQAIAHALRKALELVENGTPQDLSKLS